MFSKARNWMAQGQKSGRVRYAVVFSLLVLLVAIGVASANGPMRPPTHPPMGGMWGRPMPPRPWYPMEPVPKIKILAVVKDQSVTFETSDFPEDKEFAVTMGPIYSRGVNGYEVGTFNSGDGSTQELTFPIPEELAGHYRIAVRAQSDDARPFFAFNWFYNNDAAADTTATTTEAEAEVPADSAGTGGAEAEVEEAAPAEEEAAPAEAEGEEAASGEPSLIGVTWQWTNFTDPVQGALAIDAPEQYTIEFAEEGLVAIKADCNNGSGTYITDGGSIDIAIGAVTLALCAPESLSDQFINYLGDVAVYSFDGDDLLLDLPVDSGTLRFSPVGAEAEGETPTEAPPVQTDEAEEAAPAEGEEAEAAPAEGEEAAPAEGEEAEAAPAEATLTGVTWEWIGFTDPVSEPLVIEEPSQYTIEFMEDGTVGVKADCNNGSGSYTAEDGSISISVMAMTLALCAPESLSDQFVDYLSTVAVYSFFEGDLLLDLPVDSGTLRFQAAAEEMAIATTASVANVTNVSYVAADVVQTAAVAADAEEQTVPSFTVCSVVKDDTVTIVTENFPADQTFKVQMGPMPAPQPMRPMWSRPMPHPQRPMPPHKSGGMGAPMPMAPSGNWGPPMQPKVWIPYYEAGSLESGDGASQTATFDIPAELAGTYRISILLRTDHRYPYMAYNWFYNNTADVCNGNGSETEK